MTKLCTDPSILIGLAGGAGSGKTTIANELKKANENKNYAILSFAHPMKQALIQMTGLSSKWFYDIEYKEKPIAGLGTTTPRIMMQMLGTEYAREMISPDFWLWRMRKSLSKFSDRNIIIDDVRFENEASLIRDNGGVMIHLDRVYAKPTKQNNHKSERKLKRYSVDFHIKGSTVEETLNYAMNSIGMYCDLNH